MIFVGEKIKVNLEKDSIIKAVDEPTFGTSRRREELRINQDGVYYLYTFNDHEEICIKTAEYQIKGWAEREGIEI